MTRHRRLAFRSGAALAVVAVAGVVALPSASAWPTNCSYGHEDNRSSWATCKSGTGYFRAALYCRDPSNTLHYRPGRTAGSGTTWARPGQYSIAYCQGDEVRAFNGIESKN